MILPFDEVKGRLVEYANYKGWNHTWKFEERLADMHSYTRLYYLLPYILKGMSMDDPSSNAFGTSYKETLTMFIWCGIIHPDDVKRIETWDIDGRQMNSAAMLLLVLDEISEATARGLDDGDLDITQV